MTTSRRLRRATVQVCDADENVVGTGFLIGSDPWLVMTCQHVATRAGVPPSAAAGAELVVRFPERSAATRRAFVVGRPHPHDDDVVVVQLHPPQPPAVPEDVMPLSPAVDPDNHSFKSYGFRALDKYEGGLADGRIQGYLPPPADLNLACEPLQIISSQIDGGMSGAPLFDTELDRVVGVISETYYTREGHQKDRDTAWAIDGKILDSFPAAARPDAGDGLMVEGPEFGSRLTPVRPGLGWRIQMAPTLPSPFVNRAEELARLDSEWESGRGGVVLIHGDAGLGKTALVRRWAENLREGDPPPEGAFWWSFGDAPDSAAFFGAAIEFFSGGAAPTSMQRGPARVQLLAAYLIDRRALVVLDQIDALSPDAARDLHDLTEALARRQPGGSLCVITARTAGEWERNAGPIGLTPLSREDAVELIESGDAGPVVSDLLAEEARTPLLAQLLARSLDPPETAGLAETLPAGEQLQAIGDERIAQIPPAERAMLAAIALMRRPLPVHWARSLGFALEAQGEVGAFDAAEALDALVRGGLVQTLDSETPLVSIHQVIRTRAIAASAERAPGIQRALAEMWWGHRARDPDGEGGERRPAESLSELVPAVESVHHLCLAGEYEQAWRHLWAGVYRGPEFTLVNHAGEWGVDFDLVLGFFPGEDLALEPVLADPVKRAALLNEAALDLRNLGRPRESIDLFKRSAEVGSAAEGRHSVVAARCRQAETMAGLGELAGSREIAEGAVALGTEDGDRPSLSYAHATLGWALALQGRLEEALEHYSRARDLTLPSWLGGPRGAEETIVRWWTGETESIGERWGEIWTLADSDGDRLTLATLSRIRGEMVAARRPEAGLERLRTALAQAAELIAAEPLIEALIATGAAIAAAGIVERLDEARGLLDEAVRLTDSSGWRLFEPRARIGLAHVALRQGEEASAERHLRRAVILAGEFGNALDLALAEHMQSPGCDLSSYVLTPVPLNATEPA